MLQTNSARILSLSLLLGGTIAVQNPFGGPKPSVTERPDLAYAAEVANGKHRLDVFASAGARNAPVVIFVHGGDWRTHDRKDFSYLGRSLATEGFVVVVPSYRLWPSANGAQMSDDVAHATAWTLQHAREYGGKPNSVILIGHSSGAHLAALVALDPRYLGRYHVSLTVVRGVISISGVDDLRYLNGPVISGAFGSAPDQRWNFSPLKYARRDVPPFEIVCAQGDVRIFCLQGQLFFLALRLKGASAEYYTGPGNHASELFAAAGPADRLHLKIVQFVRAHA